MNVNTIQLQFIILKDKHCNFCETYNSQKWKIEPNNEFKDMIDEKQFNLIGDTFVLMEHAIDKLNDMNSKLKVMKDWIGTFFNKLNTKFQKVEGNWGGIDKALKNYYYEKIDVSQYEYIMKLNKVLNEINLNFEDIILLMEIIAVFKKDICSETETDIDNPAEEHKNKNRVPKTSSLTSEETQIAKNVSEIRTINHCNIHNRACLNRDNSKENHVEITFMMLSIWASEMNKGLATPTNPPTHPLFAYRHPSKTKPSYLQPSAENSLLPSSSYIPFSLYNSLQMFPAPYTAHVLEQTPTMTTKLPTISDFLKQIDDNEDNGLRFCDVRRIHASCIREAGNFASKSEYAWLNAIIYSYIAQKNMEFHGISKNRPPGLFINKKRHARWIKNLCHTCLGHKAIMYADYLA
ncbi:hypothetical protein RhiirA4_423825 [Rhizophagus irregularis]|uniref:Uncharacterized protein n=1 Tax=Rhizophagus irregularis TaxID=588596 RepID=A0A2I1GVA2_9GLOM|nr:hypothetical protein RhiirA4_423825 [Rhizophagus irregularis]